MSITTESITRILRASVEVPEESSVWLEPVKEGKIFKCNTCGKTLFHRQHRIIALFDGYADQQLINPPISVQCVSCGHIYHVKIM